tara:strand:+ start:6977 stop:7159 length:183 start_codon:yes stop_codon:yes gene_type:complete
VLTLDQTNLSSSGTFGRFFDREVDPLPFSEQLEHGSSNSATMEEVFNPTFVPNEAKTFID